MKIYRFDPEVGKTIDRYDSSGFVISKIVHLLEEAVINCAHLSAGGIIGYHRSTLPQLFLVVQGQGWVRGEAARISIQAGQAAYWETGEWHESGTKTGMTAVIIEAKKFDPAELMPPV
jgi:quercetin dioxygenase-like cupin family protein